MTMDEFMDDGFWKELEKEDSEDEPEVLDFRN